jgi:8-oxo-dGTP diphosphatase
MERHVRVGTGVIIVRDGKMLLGKRNGSHFEGHYSFPGGHQDYLETWEECVLRETKEECGDDFKIKIRGGRPIFVTNDPMPEYGKHYVTIFIVADHVEGEPINAEPDKCDGWGWYTFDEAEDLTSAPWIPWDLMERHREEIGV